MYMVTYQVLKVWTQHHFVPVPSHTFSNTKCGKLLKELHDSVAVYLRLLAGVKRV